MNRSLVEPQSTGATVVWPRSEQAATPPDPLYPELRDSPAGEIERILREYACECYAIGRGESMYYLVEDLPRIAHAATQEILAVQPRGVGHRWRRGLGIQGRGRELPAAGQNAPVPVFDSKSAPKDWPVMVGQTDDSTARRGARSVVPVLPVLTVVAALGLTVLLAFTAL